MAGVREGPGGEARYTCHVFRELDGPQVAESVCFQDGHEGGPQTVAGDGGDARGYLVLRARSSTGGVKGSVNETAQSELGREPDDVLVGDISEIKGPPVRQRVVITTHEDHRLFEEQPHLQLRGNRSGTETRARSSEPSTRVARYADALYLLSRSLLSK